MNKTPTKEYLTESSLVSFLLSYIDSDGICNKKFLDYKFRPDYVSYKLKLVVEFDGYMHYTKSSTVIGDQIKNDIFKNEGYNIVRIPYFVQLDKHVMKYLFGTHVKESFDLFNFPHGFIDDKALLPADFCTIGIGRFLNDLDIFHFIKEEIISSLDQKVLNGLHRQTVFWK